MQAGLELARVAKEAIGITESVCASVVVEIGDQYSLLDEPFGDSELRERVFSTMGASEPGLVGTVTSQLKALVEDYNALAQRDRLFAEDVLPGRVVGQWSVQNILSGVIRWAHAIRDTALNTTDDRVQEAVISLDRDSKKLARIAGRFNHQSQDRYRREVNSVRLALSRIEAYEVALSTVEKYVSTAYTDPELRRGLSILAAAEEGFQPDSEAHVRTFFGMMGSAEGGKTLTGVPALLPRKLWDHVLPYAAVVGQTRMRGTLTGDKWLPIVGFSGASAGLTTHYGAAKELVIQPASRAWAVEVDRPTIFPDQKGFMSDLKYWVEENPITFHAYRRLTTLASAGALSNGESTARVWLDMLRQIRNERPGFTALAVESSLTQRSIVAIHGGSSSYTEFRCGLLERILAALPSDECQLAYQGYELGVKRDQTTITWEVKRSATEVVAVPEAWRFLEGIAAQIYLVYLRRGVHVSWILAKRLEEVVLYPKSPNFVREVDAWPDIDKLRSLRLETLSPNNGDAEPDGIR